MSQAPYSGTPATVENRVALGQPVQKVGRGGSPLLVAPHRMRGVQGSENESTTSLFGALCLDLRRAPVLFHRTMRVSRRHLDDIVDLLPGPGRAGRAVSYHIRTDWALAWLCGDHLVVERCEVRWQFAYGIDAATGRAHRAFLAS